MMLESTLADAFSSTMDLDDLDIALRHIHLPKLVEAGCIAWDRHTGTIGPGKTYDIFDRALQSIEQSMR